MATKKLREENRLLREEIQDLKKQMLKFDENIKKQKPSKSKAIEEHKDQSSGEVYLCDERSEAIDYISN